jgi:hypothetical protein
VAYTLEFRGIGLADALAYCWEALGSKAAIGADAAQVLADAALGDLRLIERDLSAAVRIANSKRVDRITPDIAQAAVKAGLRPAPGRGRS